MKLKTLLIGLDGASFTVLDWLVKEYPEKVPFLKNIYQNGARGVLISTPNPLTPPAWVSLMTGRRPGNHGIFDFIKFEDLGDEVFFTLYDARDIQCETIWSLMSRAGKKVAVLNFPFTAPPTEEINGYLVPGFISWKYLGVNIHPQEFYEELKSLPWFDRKILCWDFDLEKKVVEGVEDKELKRWIEYHIKREEQWFKLGKYLLENKNLDFMGILFDGVDKIQHQLWHLLDPSYRKSTEYSNSLFQLCLKYFEKLDSYLSELTKLAGPEAQIFIASDHGFTGCENIVAINSFLEKKGYLKWKKLTGSEEDERREKSMFANLDWKHTIAFCPTPSSNGIYIRISKESGKPGIDPSKYHEFREQLIRELRELRDPKSGKRIFRRILKRENIFSGQAEKRAPDILLVLNDYGFVSIKNRSQIIEKRSRISGTHHPEGIFMALGPGIKKGEVIPPIEIIDVPCAILYSQGIEIPLEMEGKIPQFVFTEPFKSPKIQIENFIKKEDLLHKRKTLKQTSSNEIQEELLEQLRALGYIE